MLSIILITDVKLLKEKFPIFLLKRTTRPTGCFGPPPDFSKIISPNFRVSFFKKIGNFSFSNFTSVIRIIDSKSLNYNFLHKFLYFQYIFGETKKMQRQSIAIRNLQLNEYRAIQIPIPPLVEQKRIVAVLDKTFTAIDKIKNNTEKKCFFG